MVTSQSLRKGGISSFLMLSGTCKLSCSHQSLNTTVSNTVMMFTTGQFGGDLLTEMENIISICLIQSVYHL